MSGWLTLVSHAATAATRVAAFPMDEPVERPEPGRPPGTVDAAARGPELRCLQTAEALGLAAAPDERLADWDVGRWAGSRLEEVAAAEPDAMTRWLTEPDATPHDGESLLDLLDRVADWLDDHPPARRMVGVTHPAVVKAVLVTVMESKPSAFWRVDVSPGARVVLRGAPGRWTLRALMADD